MGNNDDYVKPPKKNENKTYVVPPKKGEESLKKIEEKTYVAPPTKDALQSKNYVKKDYVKPPKKSSNSNKGQKNSNTYVPKSTPQQQVKKNSEGGYSILRWIAFVIGIFFINEAIGSNVDFLGTQLYTTLFTDYTMEAERALSIVKVLTYSFYLAFYWIFGGSILKLFLSFGEARRRYTIIGVLAIIFGLAFLYNWSGFVGGLAIIVAVILLNSAQKN